MVGIPATLYLAMITEPLQLLLDQLITSGWYVGKETETQPADIIGLFYTSTHLYHSVTINFA